MSCSVATVGLELCGSVQETDSVGKQLFLNLVAWGFSISCLTLAVRKKALDQMMGILDDKCHLLKDVPCEDALAVVKNCARDRHDKVHRPLPPLVSMCFGIAVLGHCTHHQCTFCSTTVELCQIIQ